MCYRIVSCALYFMSFPVRRDQSDTPDGIWAVGATWVTAKAKHATGCSCAPRPLPRARLAELDRGPRRVLTAAMLAHALPEDAAHVLVEGPQIAKRRLDHAEQPLPVLGVEALLHELAFCCDALIVMLSALSSVAVLASTGAPGGAARAFGHVDVNQHFRMPFVRVPLCASKQDKHPECEGAAET